MARGFTSLNLSQREVVDQIRYGKTPPVSEVSTPAGPKWHGGVLEKVVAGVLLAALAGLWGAGATAVERLGKIPQHELRLNTHDAEINDLKKAMAAEEKGRNRLIELLEEDATARVPRERGRGR